MAPPKPTRPATEPTARRGKMSAGRIITRVDHDCCPKNAMLNSTMAMSTGDHVTKMTSGMTAALAPSAILREKFERMAAPDQPAGEPPAHETAYARRSIGNPREVADALGIEAADVVQILRQPEEVEVPGGVAEKLGRHQTPDLAVGEELEPRNAGGRLRGRLHDFGGSLRVRRRQMRGCSGGRPVIAHPPERPEQSRPPRKGRTPSASSAWRG